MSERLVRLSRAKGESVLQDGKEMKEIFFDRPINGSEFPYRAIVATEREGIVFLELAPCRAFWGKKRR